MSDVAVLDDGFQDYVVVTNDTPNGYKAFIMATAALSFCLIAPLVLLSRRYEKLRQEAMSMRVAAAEATATAAAVNNETPPDGEQDDERCPEQEMVEIQTRPAVRESTNGNLQAVVDNGFIDQERPRLEANGGSARRVDQQQLGGGKQGHVVGGEIAFSSRLSSQGSVSNLPDPPAVQFPSVEFVRGNIPTTAVAVDGGLVVRHSGAHISTDRASAVPSAASTSMLRRSVNHRRRKRPLRDLSARMRWNQRISLLATQSSQQQQTQPSQQQQTQQQQQQQQDGGSRPRVDTSESEGSQVYSRSASRRGISDAASSVLVEETNPGEAAFYRQRYVQRSQRSRRGSETSIGSLMSVMPPLSPDVLSPEDAADAADPGRENNLPQFDANAAAHALPLSPPRKLAPPCEWLLDLAEPDFETKRLIEIATPTSLGAIADPLFRLILVAIIDHMISTNSMVAYVLTALLFNITVEEVFGAITDSASNLLQNAMAQEGDSGYYHAGQIMQLALTMQVVLGLPLLVTWVYVMYFVVRWLVDSTPIAELARSYAGVIVVDYLVQALSRTLMLPFQLGGMAQFEVSIDLGSAVLTIIAVGLAASRDHTNLNTVAWIQVIVGVAKTVTKMAYVVLRGWFAPYRKGLFGALVIAKCGQLREFVLSVLPLLVGSLIELREWPIITFFVNHLGSAEVATWAVMGIVWEVLEAATEGLSDAAALRISFYLMENNPAQAKALSNKSIYLGAIQALIVTSIVFMAGPNIAVALTNDPTLQHLIVQTVGPTGLANVTMTFAQVYWSVVGAQGRFGVASTTILVCRWLVTIPLAAILIFGFFYDLVSVSGAIAIGFATASSVLASCVFVTDWNRVAHKLHEQMSGPMIEDDGIAVEINDDNVDDDDEDEDDDFDFDDEDSSGIM